MASLSSRTQFWWKPGADQRFKLPLQSVVTSLLPRFLMGSCVCLSCTLADPGNADEPPATPNVALQGDGRFLGYARLREGTSIPATFGKVVALGPRRWGFVPVAVPELRRMEAVNESESAKITGPKQRGTVTGRVDSVTLSSTVSTSRDGGERTRGNAAILAFPGTGKSVATENSSEPIVLITENLMLQRIVQAIREDELDSLWQITGQVTEYFGENRLTILTAQRGQVKQLQSADGR
ncbi:MAG TPA: hypothetical protein DEF45_14310 [Rhodopirellula sp.]|nr:MAG: hypothetical protein CBD74_09180 [Saprospirales bacterium TMED214]HBV64184.1 hypothetical protein [Rhodopirellula sp.]